MTLAYCKRLAARIADGSDVLDADRRCRDLLEAEIERRGGNAINLYVFYLGQAVGMGYGPNVAAPDKLFALIRATPAQRAQAFLAAVEGV